MANPNDEQVQRQITEIINQVSQTLDVIAKDAGRGGPPFDVPPGRSIACFGTFGCFGGCFGTFGCASCVAASPEEGPGRGPGRA